MHRFILKTSAITPPWLCSRFLVNTVSPCLFTIDEVLSQSGLSFNVDTSSLITCLKWAVITTDTTSSTSCFHGGLQVFNMIWVAIRVDESGDHCLTTIPETASCTTLDLIRIFHSNFWSVLCILITQAPGPRLHIGDEAMCYVLMITTAMSHTHTHTHTHSFTEVHSNCSVQES